MDCNLQDFFNSLEDPRRSQGVRHQFNDILTMVIMAILSGHQGLRGFARFAKANAEELTKVLNLKHGVPCFYTFRSVLSGLEQQLLAQSFIDWVKTYLPQSADTFVAIDGKAIKATKVGGNTCLHNFVSVVNAFGHSSGMVYGMESFENGKIGEAQALRELVKKLGLKDKVLTLDALHTQKKHLT